MMPYRLVNAPEMRSLYMIENSLNIGREESIEEKHFPVYFVLKHRLKEVFKSVENIII